MIVYAGLVGQPYEMVWGCSSAGEHFVDIEGVTGSIPVTPTISPNIFEAEPQLWHFFVFGKALTSSTNSSHERHLEMRVSIREAIVKMKAASRLYVK